MVGLPIEFAELQDKIHHITQNNNNHFRSSCPECGDAGHDHRNGPPDRFQMWLVSNTTGGPFGWCNRCNYKWWPSKDVKDQSVDPETIRKLEQQARRNQAIRDQKRRDKLAEFSDHEIWKEYAERMQKAHQDWWLRQGIPLDAQTYLSLGYTKERKYKYQGQMYSSPAYTIPWFGDNFSFLTMQYRLTDPISQNDKYRFEYDLEGGGTHIFRADPGEEISDKIIICEGAKKAIVTRFQLLPINTQFSVVGVAGKSTLKPAIEVAKDADLVYIILDPDGMKQARDLQEELGHKSHIVSLPYKVDDGFVKYGLTSNNFERILNNTL